LCNRRGIFAGFTFTCFVFTVFLVLLIPCISAQDGVITSIEVTGLKRTKPHIARYPLEKFLGRDAQTLDLNEVTAAIKDTGILEPQQVELVETEEGITLRVAVEDKWSFFIAPVAFGGSGGINAGLFMADTNAFGLRDQTAIGGLYGTSGIIAIAHYSHTPKRALSPGWVSSFMYNRDERKDASRDGKIRRRYTSDELYLTFKLNFPFTDHITGSAALSFSDYFFHENAAAFNQPEEGAVLLCFSPGFLLRYSSWDGYLLSQQILSLAYTYNHAITGSSFHKAEYRIIYEQSLIPGFRINVRSGGLWKAAVSGSLNPLFEEGPQRSRVDILPSKTSARMYAGLSAGLEKYLIKMKWGTLSVLGSWQCVFSQGPLSDNITEFSHGPSAGICFYLSRLAIPALGANISYNVSTGIYQFSFSIGTGFF